MSYMTYEPSLSNCCWVIAEARFLKNIKFKVTTPRSKVKCQEFAYRCTLGLTGSSLIPTQIKSAKICKMTLTYIFNFQPQCHGQRSNIKIDMPRGNYGVRQHCKPNIKLLPYNGSSRTVQTKILLWRSPGQGQRSNPQSNKPKHNCMPWWCHILHMNLLWIMVAE